MPTLEHLAVSTQGMEAAARFHLEVLGTKEFENDAATGVERSRGSCGGHHFGNGSETGGLDTPSFSGRP
jgi:hypothetical protein